MSSLASLTAVIDSMKTTGTAVVNQGREDTCGMVCRTKKVKNTLLDSVCEELIIRRTRE